MYSFRYHRPDSVGGARQTFMAAADPVYLAGGQTLLPTLKQRLANPTDVIDLGSIPGMTGDVQEDGGRIKVPAMTRHAVVAQDPLVRARIPALAKLASGIGDAQVRNMGTIGGSLANNDPTADYPAAVLGLGAQIVTSDREIAAEDFITGMFETALHPGELLLAVEFPVPRAAAYEKFPNPASRYAIVGVMVARIADGVRVAVTGAGDCAFRVAEYERALTAKFAPDALLGPVPSSNLNTDLHASAEYRAHLIWVLARRAVAAVVRTD